MSLLPEPDTEAALDAYSRVVTAVAADLTPHVAALQVTGPDGRSGAGSAVVVSTDGLLLTNAHVVGRAAAGMAVFSGRRATPGGGVGAHPPSHPALAPAPGSAPGPHSE